MRAEHWGACVLIMFGCAFVGVLFKGCRTELYQATVLDKAYTPSRVSTGTGVGTGPKGEAVVVVTTSSEPEKWTLIVRRADSGEVTSALVTARVWVNAKPGDRLFLEELVFRWDDPPAPKPIPRRVER